MSDIPVSSLQMAVADVLATLSRKRISKDSPCYLVYPRLGFDVTLTAGESLYVDVSQQNILVQAPDSWGHTEVTLHLSKANRHWVVLGDVAITYGKDYPKMELRGGKKRFTVTPSFARLLYEGPFKYDIRQIP